MDTLAYVVAGEHADKPHLGADNTDTVGAWDQRHLAAEEDDPAVQEQAPESAPALDQADTPASDAAEDVQDIEGTPDTADIRDKATNRGTRTAVREEGWGKAARAQV